jgi:hypothetical protein
MAFSHRFPLLIQIYEKVFLQDGYRSVDAGAPSGAPTSSRGKSSLREQFDPTVP